jgi:hypothetical protein
MKPLMVRRSWRTALPNTLRFLSRAAHKAKLFFLLPWSLSALQKTQGNSDLHPTPVSQLWGLAIMGSRC